MLGPGQPERHLGVVGPDEEFQRDIVPLAQDAEFFETGIGRPNGALNFLDLLALGVGGDFVEGVAGKGEGEGGGSRSEGEERQKGRKGQGASKRMIESSSAPIFLADFGSTNAETKRSTRTTNC